MNDLNWMLVAVLVAGAAVGAATILPYAFAMMRSRLAELPLSENMLRLAQFAQATILAALLVIIGLLAGRPIGLGAPKLEALLAGAPAGAVLAGIVPLAVTLGAAAGVVILLLQVGVMFRIAPALGEQNRQIALWKRVIAGFYGGINEEILMRLGLLTVLAWLISRVFPGADGTLAAGVFWAANVLAALAFGAGHLGAVKAVTPLTPAVISLTLLLNGMGGLVFGWLYWQHGLLAAMIAHFTADMVLHVVGPRFYPEPPRARDEPGMTAAQKL
ncbi:MAG: CPBP family intramembrane metalloprotease [Anaerolineae bacterium]|nr:CPBP family intramembrane metalloprotease [Anaerolineae bacterium]